MKKTFIFTALAVLILVFSGQSFADTYVNGYTLSNGTFVQGHYRSSPDSTTSNNWSTKGNTNPYTGQPGTRNAYSNPYGTSNNSLRPSGIGSLGPSGLGSLGGTSNSYGW